MDKIPFSLYDIAGYIAGGAILMTGFAVAFLPPSALELELTAAALLMLVLLSYILGHAVATISDGMLSALLVENVIGPSERWLLTAPRRPGLLGRFPYYKPLTSSTISRLQLKVSQVLGSSSDLTAKEMFAHCYSRTILKQQPRERLYIFLALYGFCRNTCVGLMIAAMFIAFGASEPVLGFTKLFVVTALLSGALLLFVRYLKFYRHYTKQVFELYLEGD